jgi:hypothetical protein
MDHSDTLIHLRSVVEGTTSLSSLIGTKFEGTFGRYRLAGLITSARVQNNCLYINWLRDNPYVRVGVLGSATLVELEMGDNLAASSASSDFIIL